MSEIAPTTVQLWRDINALVEHLDNRHLLLRLDSLVLCLTGDSSRGVDNTTLLLGARASFEVSCLRCVAKLLCLIQVFLEDFLDALSLHFTGLSQSLDGHQSCL